MSGLEFRVQGVGLRVEDLGGVQGAGVECWVFGS